MHRGTSPARGRYTSARWRSAKRRLAPNTRRRRRASTILPLLQDQGDLTGAQALVKRALAIYGKLPGPEDQYTATSLNTLALLLQAQAELAGARPLFERALAIREKFAALSMPIRPRALTTSGICFRRRGIWKPRGASRARASTRERALGSEHPLTAQSLNNLASLRQAQGDLAGAQQLLRARPGDQGEGARPSTSRHRPDTTQSCKPAPCPRRANRRARVVRGGARRHTTRFWAPIIHPQSAPPAQSRRAHRPRPRRRRGGFTREIRPG